MATPAVIAAEVDATSTNAPPLPPPSTFDILPPLHQLLIRLLAQSSALSIPLPEGQESVPQVAVPVANDPAALTYKDLQPLEIQHLAQEAAQIKIRIQKARQAIKALPDMDKSIEDQQEEIEDLMERCEQLRRVLRGMAERADVEKLEAQSDLKQET